MAQLKDLLVAGPSRLIGDAYATNLQLTTLLAPTASNGTTYGAGTSGQVLLSNGTSSYWGTPSVATSTITGTLGISNGGTGATTAANARTNLGLGSFATRSSLAWNEIAQSGANSIQEGTSDFTDNTEIFSSYASNNGFADTNALGKVYRRDAIKMYNYIKSKASSDQDFSVNGNAATATQLNHKLTIGTIEFDGSADASVPIYDGSIT